MSSGVNETELKRILEVLLLCADGPVSVDAMADIVSLDAKLGGQAPEDSARIALRVQIRSALEQLEEDCTHRGVEIVEVASGFRFQVKSSFGHWIGRLQAERPARYSRALLETLALVAYQQPITRGEIEEVRGVGVSASIMKTLHEREWIRVLGHREVPGRPAMYGTTKKFLDDFGLRKLDELPPLAEIRELENIHRDLFSDVPVEGGEILEGELAGAGELEASGSSAESGSPAEATTGSDQGETADDLTEGSEESGDELARPGESVSDVADLEISLTPLRAGGLLADNAGLSQSEATVPPEDDEPGEADVVTIDPTDDESLAAAEDALHSSDPDYGEAGLNELDVEVPPDDPIDDRVDEPIDDGLGDELELEPVGGAHDGTEEGERSGEGYPELNAAPETGVNPQGEPPSDEASGVVVTGDPSNSSQNPYGEPRGEPSELPVRDADFELRKEFEAAPAVENQSDTHAEPQFQDRSPEQVQSDAQVSDDGNPHPDSTPHPDSEAGVSSEPEGDSSSQADLTDGEQWSGGHRNES